MDFDVYVERVNKGYLTDEVIIKVLKDVYKKGYDQARLDILSNTRKVLEKTMFNKGDE